MRKIISNDKLHDTECRGISYSADGRYLTSAGFDKKVIITDTLNSDNLQVIKSFDHDDKALSVKWHPYLPLFISTSADKSARIWAPVWSGIIIL